MAKKEKKSKGEGRKPTLAPFVDSVFKIYMNHNGKEHEATVLSSGIIRYKDKDYTSPSSVGQVVLGKQPNGDRRTIDGWKSWYYNKDGERVMLNTLRGSKSPLSLEAPKAKREKKAKANGAEKKPRKARKPRTSAAKQLAAQEERREETAA